MKKNGRPMTVSGSACRLGITLLCYLMILAIQFSSAAEFDAKCILRSTEQGQKYGISGYIQFTFDPKNTHVKVMANIQGNSAFGANSKYAMHIHEYGDLSDLSAGLSAGPHFVSEGSFPNHGCPPSDKRHTGDMGNWTVKDNAIQETKELDLLELTASQSIVGRSVVLHERVDDCTGTNGNSGDRTAFCVIGITDLDFNLASAGDFLPKDPESICVFQPTANCKGTCSGVAYISGSSYSRVRVHVQGITGVRALHLHQYGDLSAADGSTTGNDYDPNGRDHNLPNDNRHLGDLGNIQSYDPKTGDAWYDKNFTSFSTWEDLLGRSLVIYDGRDNGAGATCDWEGSSGNIIMMCVLGIRNPTTTIPSIPAEVTINNLFVSQKCGDSPSHNSGDDDDKGGLVAGLVIGWLLFSLLLVGLIGFVIYRFIYKRRSFENIYEGSTSF